MSGHDNKSDFDGSSDHDHDNPIDRTAVYGTDRSLAELGQAFHSGEIPVAVYGLGKMGLPVATVLADVTGNVVGADVDPEVVESVNSGVCPVDHEPDLPELVSETVESGALRAVEEPREAAGTASIHVIVVPTLLTEENEPDLSIVEAVVEDVAAGLDRGDLVCVESTLPPGTCRDVITPLLAAESGLNPGSFGVAFCPERTSSGRALEDIQRAYPKVVGGVDPESTRVAEVLYGGVTENDVIPLTDATTAEAMKVFGGVYRDVNVALANEFARYAEAMGIDAREAIDASNSQPYSHILQPGPGVGGHCIPIYPHFLFESYDVDAPLGRVARIVNGGMAEFTVRKLQDMLSERDVSVQDATVLLMGVTYRPGVPETRNSPSIEIAELLAGQGTTLYAADPLVDPTDSLPATGVDLDEISSLSPDAVVVCTPHEAFHDLDWDGIEPTIVLDAHNELDLDETAHWTTTIGRPADRPVDGPTDRPMVESPERTADESTDGRGDRTASKSADGSTVGPLRTSVDTDGESGEPPHPADLAGSDGDGS